MEQLLILIANSTEAQIYQSESRTLLRKNGHSENDMILLKQYHHADSRKKGIDLITDGAGSYRTMGGAGHGSFSEATPPKEVEVERFAVELAHDLEEMRAQGNLPKLMIVAPPHFLGLLKKHLSAGVKGLMCNSIEKNYTIFKGRDLVSQLRLQIPDAGFFE